MLDAVIVGAGAAGLAAARRLQDHKASFRLLEAKGQVGGRAVTDTATLGVPVDLGCHWLHSPALNPLTPLADRYGFHVKQTTEEFRVTQGGRLLAGAELAECLAYIEQCFAKFATLADGNHDCVAADLFPFQGKWHGLFEAAFTAKQGMSTAESSALDFASYVWEGEDLPVLDGLGALIARHAHGLPVELETPATRIDWSGESGVTVETPRGTLNARTVILTASTGVLASQAIRFAPDLPDWKRQAIADLPMGSCNKVILGFAANPFGDLHDVMLMPDLGPGQSVELLIREGGRDIVTVMFNGPAAKQLAAEGEWANVDYALTVLADIFGGDVKRHMTGRHVFADWDHDPWVRGCYSTARPGGAAARAALARPLEDRLFFAGEATHGRFIGDVHGAHLRGEAAAEAVLAAIGR